MSVTSPDQREKNRSCLPSGADQQAPGIWIHHGATWTICSAFSKISFGRHISKTYEFPNFSASVYFRALLQSPGALSHFWHQPQWLVSDPWVQNNGSFLVASFGHKIPKLRVRHLVRIHKIICWNFSNTSRFLSIILDQRLISPKCKFA